MKHFEQGSRGSSGPLARVFRGQEPPKQSPLKRLFFGLEIQAVWMDPLPEGRILKEENRHVTLFFVGNASLSQMQEKLKDFPDLSLCLGPVGRCDHLLFLPKGRPRVVAGHIDWLDLQEFDQIYQKLSSWLIAHGYVMENREVLSHVTIARSPFDEKKWKKAFFPFPLIATSFHLYESVGNLEYHPVWSRPLIAPIEEIEHTADIAFLVRGKNIQQLFLHAQLALAFKFPGMLYYFSEGKIQDLDDLIIQLNQAVSRADAELGCPFKAVSFHGKIVPEENGLMRWEMIIDV